MYAYGFIKSEPNRATDIYTEQCSISVNAKDLAAMAGTLANGGKNPITGKQVMKARERPRGSRGDGDRGPLRRQRQVVLPHRTAGQERRRRRPHRRLARQVRHRGGLAAARRRRQQRPRQKAITDISNALGGKPVRQHPALE
jgi:hypothetical protein